MKTLKAVVAKYNQTSLILRILIGLAVGSVLALVAPGAGWVGELGSLFVGALKGIAPVLVFVIVASALAQGSSKLDRRFGTVIWLYMLTTFLAAAIAAITSFMFPVTVVLADAAQSDVIPQGLGEVLSTLLTNFVANPVSALMNGNYIGILFWACMFGIAMKNIGAESTKVFLANTADAVSQIVRWIINLAPFGIMGLVYTNVSGNGLAIFTQYGKLLALLAGFAAGALWALLPTLFAGRNLTSLSVATIMMNSIAALLTEYIVKSYFQRPGASNTETVVVNEGSILPRIFPSTQFNYGILVALFCVVVVTWMLYKTPFGFSLRAMGSNPRAMQQAGLPIYGRTIAAMCISGGLFALGGSIQCLAVYKRFVMGFSPGYGWDGITVATLAMNSPVGVLLSAFLFGMLRSASISMSLTSQVTTEMISVLQGFIVMLVASPDVWNVLGHLWQRLKSCVGRGRKQEGAAE